MITFNKKTYENTANSILFHGKTESKTLVITFSGIGKLFGLPIYEFYNILDNYNVNKVFIRDTRQTWFVKGIDQELSSVSKLKLELKKILNFYSCEKVVFIGNSAGAYGALLYGNLLKINKIIAFAPQTFLSHHLRKLHKDERWQMEIEKLQKMISQKEYKYLDLLNCELSKNNVDIDIHYCITDHLDKIHSERLDDLKNINFHMYHEGGHGLIRLLKTRGVLEEILNNSI